MTRQEKRAHEDDQEHRLLQPDDWDWYEEQIEFEPARAEETVDRTEVTNWLKSDVVHDIECDLDEDCMCGASLEPSEVTKRFVTFP